MNKDSKILILGHSGLAGSAMVRRLREEGFNNLILFSKGRYRANKDYSPLKWWSSIFSRIGKEQCLSGMYD